MPYLAWLLVGWVLAADYRLSGLVAFVGRALVDPQSPGALWFLYALFGSAVVLALVMRLGGSDRALIASALVVGAAGILPLGRFSNVLGLSDIAWLYPFVIAGVLAARHRDKLESLRSLLPLSLALWAASLPLVWPVVIPGPRWWEQDLVSIVASLGSLAPLVPKALWAMLRVIGALAGTYAAFALASRLRGRLMSGTAWLGKRTLGVYATHGHVLLWLAPLVAGLAVPVRAALIATGGLAMALAVTLLLERGALTRRLLLGMRG